MDAPTAVSTNVNTPVSPPISLGTMVIREKMTVNQVKQLVFNKLGDEFKEYVPASVSCIRLRDGKNKITSVHNPIQI